MRPQTKLRPQTKQAKYYDKGEVSSNELYKENSFHDPNFCWIHQNENQGLTLFRNYFFEMTFSKLQIIVAILFIDCIFVTCWEANRLKDSQINHFSH
jgi:hypothetical protein